MKIVADLLLLPSGTSIPRLYALNDNGSFNGEMTDTLLDFISELPPADVEFENLLARVESGEYVSKDPNFADWSENDKYVWLFSPYSSEGELCVSNENIPIYSVDEGQPQRFSIETFKVVRRHWKDFLSRVNQDGPESWLGRRYEIEINFPD